MLDTIANRCFAQGTNAWTDTDHTVKALTLALMLGIHYCNRRSRSIPSDSPGIYRPHTICHNVSCCTTYLTPRTDSGCVTEVYHITGEGKDAGVVYSEMQGRQNQSSDLIDLEKRRLLFPEGCGYRSETGGLMEALRILDVSTIRKYVSYLTTFTKVTTQIITFRKT